MLEWSGATNNKDSTVYFWRANIRAAISHVQLSLFDRLGRTAVIFLRPRLSVFLLIELPALRVGRLARGVSGSGLSFLF